jgi:hypothetical protein
MKFRPLPLTNRSLRYRWTLILLFGNIAFVMQAQDDEGMSGKPDTARFEITAPARKVAKKEIFI